MSQISVTLVRADTNQEFDVELPDDAAIAELLPALVKELGLPLTGPDGNQVAYELSSKRTGREFKEKDTLGTGGAKAGDVLLLTSTFVAGARRVRVRGRQGGLAAEFTKAAQDAMQRDLPERYNHYDPDAKKPEHTPEQAAAVERVRVTFDAYKRAGTKVRQVKKPEKLEAAREEFARTEKEYRAASDARDKVFGL